MTFFLKHMVTINKDGYTIAVKTPNAGYENIVNLQKSLYDLLHNTMSLSVENGTDLHSSYWEVFELLGSLLPANYETWRYLKTLDKGI